MKFMVCYNGSPGSEEALRLALNHARVWGAALEVVMTITRDSPLKHSFIQEKEDTLDRDVKEIVKGTDIPYKTQLIVGSLSAGEALVLFAKDEQMDQIFLGLEKKSRVGKLVFGSTAQYVILRALCPVVTVRRPGGKKLEKVNRSRS
ncbi:MAG: universal stress protein [Desulfatiglandaceae bacterium]